MARYTLTTTHSLSTMIHWLVQSVDAHRDLALGLAPPQLLSAAEQAQLATLKREKRRRDWILGRWTAKHLLQAIIQHDTGQRPPLDALIICNDAEGVPLATFDARPAPCHFSLSISHCAGQAFCAAYTSDEAHIGADIEHVEPRSWQFVVDYLSGEEIDQVRCAPPAVRDALVTAMWSAKEAALKALRLGLSVDTRCISCRIKLTDPLPRSWAEIDLSCDASLSKDHLPPTLSSWWRIWDGYVLTLAAKRST